MHDARTCEPVVHLGASRGEAPPSSAGGSRPPQTPRVLWAGRLRASRVRAGATPSSTDSRASARYSVTAARSPLAARAPRPAANCHPPFSSAHLDHFLVRECEHLLLSHCFLEERGLRGGGHLRRRRTLCGRQSRADFSALARRTRCSPCTCHSRLAACARAFCVCFLVRKAQPSVLCLSRGGERAAEGRSLVARRV